ncbi:MAG: zinc-dependent alcohol dehydrogenase family protein [Gammaproteobacteria bacterium]
MGSRSAEMVDHRVAVFDSVDDIADIMLSTAPRPEPGAAQVRFKVAAFALNQADLLLTQGRHYVKANLPIRLGYEGCGTVDAVGEGVTRFKVGDRVACIPNIDGPYSTAGEYALANERFLVPWPEGWSAPQAAGVWMQYLTPYFPFVELFPIKRGDWVLITAASGGTGLGSVRLAKLCGARVIATTRSEHKVATLKENGAEVVLATEREDLAAAILQTTEGKGVRLIDDTLCGPYVPRLAETLADRGIMFIHGALAGDNTLSLPVLSLVHRAAGLYGYSLINELRRPGALERARDFILAALASGDLPLPHIDQVFPFTEVRAAYDRMRAGRQTGKIIVSLER